MQEPDFRRRWIALIVALAVASIAFRVMVLHDLQHGAIMFIGIPALVAGLTIWLGKPKSNTGVILKAITLSLAVAGILFGEALVCILFASPLFYLVGLVIGWAADQAERRRNSGGAVRSMAILGLMVGSGFEGMAPALTVNREEKITRRAVVAADAGAIARALAATPSFDRPLPRFLRLEFPTPGSTTGGGLTIGARRTIEFRHGHHPGRLTLEVVEAGATRVRFWATSDDSYLTHWLTWRDATVSWRPLGPDRTEVTWTLRYRRRLDPAWYFGPLERYAVGLTAAYLIETVTTPR